METPDARAKRIQDRVETYIHSARHLAMEHFGPETSHGQAEIVTRLVAAMATLEAAEIVAAATQAKKD